MYGAMEVAQSIRIGGTAAVQDLEMTPHLRVRGMKFNAPLDARTPSYSDPSDAAQQNIATMWDASFWRELINRLARDRFNLVTLWSLPPFPSLVRVPENPDVALADVQRSTVAWKGHYPLQAMGLDAPEILGRTETIRRMTIDDKIAFWREVLRYGKSRNVRFAIVTWNVFTNGIDPARGLPADWKNAATADYFRLSVAALRRTYPDLAGVGVTAGENMVGAAAPEKEAWLAKTYGQGVLDVLADQPERRVRFVHRQHEAGAAEIARHFGQRQDHPRVDFIYSSKYAEAHTLALAQQRAAHEPARQKLLADEINRAAQARRLYGATAVTQYRNPLWTNHVGHVDWRQTFYSVLYDLTIVGATPAVPSIAPTPGGTVLEAEDAVAGDPEPPLRTEAAGYTDRGYLEFSHRLDPRRVVWNDEAPSDGRYALEFRYAIRRGLVTESGLTANGSTMPLLLWPTSGATSWAWDRKIVTLRRGLDRIELRPGAVVNFDHLNVLPWEAVIPHDFVAT